MAYMSQEKKATIQAAIKPILTKYNVKGSLSVRNHSTIVLTVKSGAINFIESLNRVCADNRNFHPVVNGHVDVNPYWYHEHFDGDALQFLDEAFNALKSADWYDKSDISTDYFCTAYYVDLNIGKWNKPYQVI